MISKEELDALILNIDAVKIHDLYKQLLDSSDKLGVLIGEIELAMTAVIPDDVYHLVYKLAEANDVVGIAQVFNELHDALDNMYSDFEISKLEGYLYLFFPDVHAEFIDKQNNLNDEEYSLWIMGNTHSA